MSASIERHPKGVAALGPKRIPNQALLIMLLLGMAWLAVASRVHVNASWSDDAWGYLALPVLGDLRIGDRVLFDPPASLASPVPWIKTVRGLPGAVVTVSADRQVKIDGIAAGRAKRVSLSGRSLDAVSPGVIPEDHFFLFGNHPDSRDSRYAEVGLVPRERIRGRAVALPDLPWLGLSGPLVTADAVGVGPPLPEPGLARVEWRP